MSAFGGASVLDAEDTFGGSQARGIKGSVIEGKADDNQNRAEDKSPGSCEEEYSADECE